MSPRLFDLNAQLKEKFFNNIELLSRSSDAETSAGAMSFYFSTGF